MHPELIRKQLAASQEFLSLYGLPFDPTDEELVLLRQLQQLAEEQQQSVQRHHQHAIDTGVALLLRGGFFFFKLDYCALLLRECSFSINWSGQHPVYRLAGKWEQAQSEIESFLAIMQARKKRQS